MPQEYWRGLRYSTLESTVAGVGTLVDGPGRLWAARLVSYSSTVLATLHDSTRWFTEAPIVGLAAQAGQPDDWPRLPMHYEIRRGVLVSFSQGGGAGMRVQVGWERAGS